MPNHASAARAAAPPVIRPGEVQQQAHDLVTSTITWAHAHWLQIAVASVVGFLIAVALHGVRRIGERLCSRDRWLGGWGSIFGHAVARTNNFFIVGLSAKLVDGYARAPAPVASTVDFLFTVAAVFQAAIWARELILGTVEHRTRSEHYNGEALLSAMGLIRLLVTVALFAVAFVVVLDNLGVNVTGLVAGLGVGGIAIGLAAQGIFADLFAALAIIFDRPFRRGDKVSYDQTSGVIESIGLKSTRIRAFSGEMRVISNRQLLDKEIQNISNREHVRVGYTIGVTYETPPDVLARIPAILAELVQAEGGAVARAGFEGFGASSLDFALQVDTPGDDWSTAHDVRNRLMVALVRRFRAEGIGLAYPTQTTYTAAPDGRLVMPYAEPGRSPPGAGHGEGDQPQAGGGAARGAGAP